MIGRRKASNRRGWTRKIISKRATHCRQYRQRRLKSFLDKQNWLKVEAYFHKALRDMARFPLSAFEPSVSMGSPIPTRQVALAASLRLCASAVQMRSGGGTALP